MADHSDPGKTARFTCDMPWGAQWAEGLARFRLWAPAATAVRIELNADDTFDMARDGSAGGADAGGRWIAELPCEPGTAYRYHITLENGQTLSIADPASRVQQGDVDDASVVVDPAAYGWQHAGWRGRPWQEAVVYELHPGAMGGFAGVTEKLKSLAALGITAIELMPVSDFPGARNWGYDGVLPFAPDTAYGTPAELKHLIDTAHGLGLMVLLDVVYNHFGPDGNLLGDYAPDFFRHGDSNAWGGAIDFSQPEVRSFFTSNAAYWIMEYRFDGLRIDAAHAISRQDWLAEMAHEVRRMAGPDRHVHLVLEHDGNASGLLQDGFDAQWNDDAHHVLHVLLTGERDGYYRDYADQPAARLARSLAEGFIYQGEPSLHRNGEARGEPSASLPPTAFVMFLQNHDQTGNRAFGERLTTLAHPAALRAAQALQLLSPHIPLLFMGEESAATEPFLYFTSHRTEELAEAVRKGRIKEFSATAAFADAELQDKIAVPNDESTFTRSIPASFGEQGEPATDWVRELLALRHARIVPHLADCRSLGAEALGDEASGDAAVLALWQLGEQQLTLVVNLGERAVSALPPAAHPNALAETLFDSGGVRHALAAGSLHGHGFIALLEPLQKTQTHE
ncbi:MAG: malto-oligosyltrehalose trehalohydrolase [Comamonadaceae bacterium]|nr:MAG: malto-oligosyltrehalose trehalohydrolase [Comamonadaceae bacterium]